MHEFSSSFLDKIFSIKTSYNSKGTSRELLHRKKITTILKVRSKSKLSFTTVNGAKAIFECFLFCARREKTRLEMKAAENSHLPIFSYQLNLHNNPFKLVIRLRFPFFCWMLIGHFFTPFFTTSSLFWLKSFPLQFYARSKPKTILLIEEHENLI